MKLLINEFIKDYRKVTTWIYMLVTMGLIGLVQYINSLNLDNDGFSKAESLADITNGATGIASIFALIMLANNLSQEYSKGTIKFLYTKPVSRSAILTAKIVLGFINYIIFAVIGTVFKYVFTNIVLNKGSYDLSLLSEKLADGYFGRTVYQQLAIVNLTGLAVMIFYIAMVVLVCVVFKTQILSLVLVMISVFGGTIIQGLTILIVDKFEWVKYHMFNVPLFQLFYATEDNRYLVKNTFKFENVNSLLIMLIAYSAIFFIVSYVINSRRDITID
ncbi:ABC transporter permease [Gemella sanguinis]|jgi:putative membrane protein|uniref:ABC transporter permease n=1 Tax=Gemella sanguinis TaxID=84135 RepID=UPI00352EB11F